MRLTYDTRVEAVGPVWLRQAYGASDSVHVNAQRFVLNAGRDDDVYFVRDRDDDRHYVVTYNTAMGYFAIGELDPDETPEPGQIGDDDVTVTVPVIRETTIHFDQHASDHELNLRPMTLIRRYASQH